jgi:hypothetical protein
MPGSTAARWLAGAPPRRRGPTGAMSDGGRSVPRWLPARSMAKAIAVPGNAPSTPVPLRRDRETGVRQIPPPGLRQPVAAGVAAIAGVGSGTARPLARS